MIPSAKEAKAELARQRKMDPHVAGNPGTRYWQDGWEAIGYLAALEGPEVTALVSAGKNLVDSHLRMADILSDVYDQPEEFQEWAQHLSEFKKALAQYREATKP